MSDPIQAGKYRHFKGPIYEVLGVAMNVHRPEWLVVYRNDAGELFLRNPVEFSGTVDRDGKVQKRFELIEGR